MSIEILLKTLVDEIKANTNAVTQLAARFGDVVVPERPAPEPVTEAAAENVMTPVKNAPPIVKEEPAVEEKSATVKVVTDDDIRTTAKSLLQKIGAEKTKAVIAQSTSGKAIDISAADRPTFIAKAAMLIGADMVG